MLRIGWLASVLFFGQRLQSVWQASVSLEEAPSESGLVAEIARERPLFLG